jgi:AhpD family alkylhydroperoxidase
MDFKGHFPMTRGGRCHALTVLDDHSRYSIGLRACDNERTETVQRELIAMYVSERNQCPACAKSHAAAARKLLREQRGLVSEILEDLRTAHIDERLRMILLIAEKVRRDVRLVTQDDVLRARQAGANDNAIHDTILIASMFCMFNRYVEGLATWAPTQAVLSAEVAERLATQGRASRLRGFA